MAGDKIHWLSSREFANNVFEARICFPLRYMSVISVLNVISQH